MKYQPHLEFSAQAVSFRALQCLYTRIAEREENQYDYVPIVIFAAFSIEAYINSIGSRNIVFWDQIERLPWKKKVEILHANAGATPSWGRAPLQFATQVFSVRDRLAHGKSETIDGPLCDTPGDANTILMVQCLKPDWFDVLDKDWIMKSNERVCELLRYLGNLYGLTEDDFTHHSQGHISNHES